LPPIPLDNHMSRRRHSLTLFFMSFIHHRLNQGTYKPTIGGAVWNRREVENKRPGTMIAEAYAKAVLRNHYFAWVYEFKAQNPNANLKTEYELPPVQVSQGTNDGNIVEQPGDEEQGQAPIKLFCSDLDGVEVSVPTVPTILGAANRDAAAGGAAEAREDQEFKLLVNEGATADAYKAASEHDQVILKTIQEKFEEDRTGNGSGRTCLSFFLKMSAKLVEDAANPETTVPLQKKRKRDSKSGLTMKFTSSTRKSKKGTDEIKGWSAEGQRYVAEMFTKIRQDERSGIRQKWEVMYKRLCEAVESRRGINGGGNEDEDEFEIDPDVLYEEV